MPELLRRALHGHEPENTTCPTPACGKAMVRIGEGACERLDTVPVEFFLQRLVLGHSGGRAPAFDVGLRVLPTKG